MPSKFTFSNSRHFAALGRFVSECSGMEVSLALLLRRMVDISPDLARAIIGIGDVRIGDMVTVIKRVAVVKKMDRDIAKKLGILLSWATYINDVRSVVAHKPLIIQNGIMVFHNTATAKGFDKKWTYECFVDELTSLCQLVETLSISFHSLPDPKVFENFSLGGYLGILSLQPDAPLLEKHKLPVRPKDRLVRSPQ